MTSDRGGYASKVDELVQLYAIRLFADDLDGPFVPRAGKFELESGSPGLFASLDTLQGSLLFGESSGIYWLSYRNKEIVAMVLCLSDFISRMLCVCVEEDVERLHR